MHGANDEQWLPTNNFFLYARYAPRSLTYFDRKIRRRIAAPIAAIQLKATHDHWRSAHWIRRTATNRFSAMPYYSPPFSEKGSVVERCPPVSRQTVGRGVTAIPIPRTARNHAPV
jgi:hypothetical protein